jgi:hypothetical protein
VYCRACLKAQKIAKREQELQEFKDLGKRMRTDLACRAEYVFFKRLDVPVDTYFDIISRIVLAHKFLDKQEAEIQELKKPIKEKLSEIANLKTELERLAPIETDNAFLREQLEKLKHEPLAEKNAWLTVELSKKDEESKKLKTEIAKQEELIKAYMFQGKTQ